MIRYFTNRELSKRFQVNLAKWKRWSREFLPPDPLGGMQSGYARQYHPDQVFSVFLGGHLVADLRFSIPQARAILADLEPWMRHHGYFYEASVAKANGKTALASSATECRIFIFLDNRGEMYYTICNRMSRTVTGDPEKTTVHDRYLECRIPERHGYPEKNAPAGCCVLLLKGMLKRFVEALELSDRHYSALMEEGPEEGEYVQ